MDAEFVLGDLELHVGEPWKLVELAREARDDAVVELTRKSRGASLTRKAGETAVDEVIARIAAGDIHLIDHQHSQDGPAERARIKLHRKMRSREEPVPDPDDLPDRVRSLLVVAASLFIMERKQR